MIILPLKKKEIKSPGNFTQLSVHYPNWDVCVLSFGCSNIDFAKQASPALGTYILAIAFSF